MGKSASDYSSLISQLSDRFLSDNNKKNKATVARKQSRKSAFGKLLMGVAVLGAVRWLRRR